MTSGKIVGKMHTPKLLNVPLDANIAHGCNSVIATKATQALADYCITEA